MNETVPPAVPGGKPGTPGLAITSLVLGILSLVLLIACVGPLLAIPAVICGHVAYSRIRRSGGELGGEGLALGGLITGYVCIGLTVLLSIIAVPNFLKAREVSQANTCLNYLTQISAAKQQWALENHKDTNAVPTWDDLNKWLKGRAPLKCPAGGTYSINAVGELPTCTISTHRLL